MRVLSILCFIKALGIITTCDNVNYGGLSLFFKDDDVSVPIGR